MIIRLDIFLHVGQVFFNSNFTIDVLQYSSFKCIFKQLDSTQVRKCAFTITLDHTNVIFRSGGYNYGYLSLKWNIYRKLSLWLYTFLWCFCPWTFPLNNGLNISLFTYCVKWTLATLECCIWFLLCGVVAWINHCRKYVVPWCKQSLKRKMFIMFYIMERYFSMRFYIVVNILIYIFPYPLRVTSAEISFQHNTLNCKCSREHVGLNQNIHYKHILNQEQVYFYSNCEKVNQTQWEDVISRGPF